ncbi:HAD family hydrolase [Candidatus Omnitrophota bacterium]
MSPRLAKLVIFDLDGTLINAYPAIISSFNHTMQRLDYPSRSALVIRRAVGWGDQNLLKPFIRLADLKRAVAVYRKHHLLSLVRESRLLPGAKRLLQYLKGKGYKLAVASNRPTRFSRILISHLKISNYFGVVLCADKLKNFKPHPLILNRILSRFSLKPQEAVYVGDMTVDAVAGRRAGIRTVIVTTGSSSRREIKKEKPWRIVSCLAGLLKFF